MCVFWSCSVDGDCFLKGSGDASVDEDHFHLKKKKRVLKQKHASVNGASVRLRV